MTHNSISFISRSGKLNRIKFHNFPGFPSPILSKAEADRTSFNTWPTRICPGDLKEYQCGNAVNLNVVSYLLPLDIESGGRDCRLTASCH